MDPSNFKKIYNHNNFFIKIITIFKWNNKQIEFILKYRKRLFIDILSKVN